MCTKKTFFRLSILIGIILFLIYEYKIFNQTAFEINSGHKNIGIISNQALIQHDNSLVPIKLKSQCSQCRKDIHIFKFNLESEPYLNVYYTDVNSLNLIYFSNNRTIDRNLLTDRTLIKNPKFTCNLYNELRHGPRQKVLSYSLYGKVYPYYNLFDKIVKHANIFYPDWIIRVYYDDSINKSIICNLECKYEKINFCDVNKIPKHDQRDIFKLIGEQDEKNAYDNLGYVHGMMWRWFPITDDFVDYFSSRDSDSTIIQREKDSVDAWLKEKTLFHVMRDNPFHNTVILGGMWGHANKIDRSSGYRIFANFLPRNVQAIFNPNYSNPKNQDQNYLAEKVWPIARQHATVHDAYNCVGFGGKPFPTRRPTDMYCFVTCFEPCCDRIHNQTERMPDCPLECRPKEHPDWNTC